MGVLRRTYLFHSWRKWDRQVDLCVQDFFSRFHIYPNIVLANLVTYKRIDLIARPDHITNASGETPTAAEYVPLGGFVGESYELSFCIDEQLDDKAFVLIYHDDPTSGEPIPGEDTESPATGKQQAL